VSPQSPKPETVLVIDNDVHVRLVIAEYLRTCGYRVVECANADEALAILRHSEIVLDLVLSDIEMPGTVDGFSLATWIRKNRPGLDVVLAGNVRRAADAAKDICDQGPTPQPPHPDLIVDRIRRLMAARPPRKS
jgi:CheY-like chemotaxis protein